MAGRVAATRCLKLTGGNPPLPPALTAGLSVEDSFIVILVVLDNTFSPQRTFLLFFIMYWLYKSQKIVKILVKMKNSCQKGGARFSGKDSHTRNATSPRSF